MSGTRWQNARQQDKADSEWTPPPAYPDGDPQDDRTISEKIRDGEIGQG